MFPRIMPYLGRLGLHTSKILNIEPRLGLGPSAFVSVEAVGRRCVGQLPVLSSTTARKLCTGGGAKEVDRKVKKDDVASGNKETSILDDFHLRSTRPTKLDRWILVFMGRYKSDEEIPDFVSNTIINSTKSKFRIVVNIGMGVFALVGGIVMIYIGRKRMQAGESIAGMNMERRKEFYSRTNSTKE